jgi:hypothetical protein
MLIPSLVLLGLLLLGLSMPSDSPALRGAAYKYSLKLAKNDPSKALRYYKLLIETSNQESHMGELNPTNPMQLTGGTTKDLVNRYSDVISEWGMEKDSPLSQNVGLAALKYLDTGIEKAKLDTPKQRAKFWKDKYNTWKGAGTTEKYLSTNANLDFSGVEEWWRDTHGTN